MDAWIYERVDACVSSFAYVRMGTHDVYVVNVCMLGCMHEYVYVCSVCMCTGVCSCEFMCSVACCSDADSFQTGNRRLGPDPNS